MIKIEKNIPIPKAKREWATAAFLSQLEIGDSFVITNHKNPSAHLYMVAKRLGIKMKIKTTTDETRAWRVA